MLSYVLLINFAVLNTSSEEADKMKTISLKLHALEWHLFSKKKKIENGNSALLNLSCCMV